MQVQLTEQELSIVRQALSIARQQVDGTRHTLRPEAAEKFSRLLSKLEKHRRPGMPALTPNPKGK